MERFQTTAFDASADRPAEMCRLGKRLLAGDGAAADPMRGAELLARASSAGDAEAAALIANLAGAGVCRPQSWSAALDLLQQAAERGWPPAQAQLALLSADRDLARRPAGDGTWRRLRAAIDIEHWLRPPPKQTLSEAPRIRKLEAFASPEVCRWMIERARDCLAPARVYHAGSGEAALDPTRSSSETDFDIMQVDVVLLLLRARIAAVTGLPPAVMELTKVLHYTVGQRFETHFDFLDPAVPAFAADLAARGQRLATLLLYLNEDYDGGETEFPAIGLRYRGRTGDALLFANVDPAGAPDRRTLHAGLPPTRGEKWLLSQWIRDRPPRSG